MDIILLLLDNGYSIIAARGSQKTTYTELQTVVQSPLHSQQTQTVVPIA